jgi:hypothetical protein
MYIYRLQIKWSFNKKKNFTSALVRGERPASHSCRFTPGEKASVAYLRGSLLGPRVCLDDVEKLKFWPLSGLEFGLLGGPARSQSLLYLGSERCKVYIKLHLANVNENIVSDALSCMEE